MLSPLLLATVMLVFGLNTQVFLMAWLVLRLPRLAQWAVKGRGLLRAVGVLDLVLLHVVVAAVLQIAGWALIFRMVGEFSDYHTAFYHSAGNFTTLGYGDIIMSPRWRLLGPFEALNGVLVLSLGGAALVSTFGHLREAHSASLSHDRR